MASHHSCMLPPSTDCDLPPTSGFCQKLYSYFQQSTIARTSHQSVSGHIRSNKSLKLERDRQIKLDRPYILHPYSAIVFYWRCFLMIYTIFFFLYIPVQVFKLCPNPWDPLILTFDTLNLMDILRNFSTGYVDYDARVTVLEPRLIFKNYLRTRFLIDFIGFLPLQLIQLYDRCEFPTHTIFFLFKLFRYDSLKRAWDWVIDELQLSYAVGVAFKVIIRLVLLFHWMAYITYQVPSLLAHIYSHEGKFHVWLTYYRVGNTTGSTVLSKYITNLYYTVKLTAGSASVTTNFPYFLPEVVVLFVVSIAGYLYACLNFLVACRLIVYRLTTSLNFKGRLSELESYMFHKRMPQSLRTKIRLFLNYKFKGHSFDESLIINTIGELCAYDINMHYCKGLVQSVPLFQGMPVTVVNMIIFSLKQIVFVPGEVVFNYDDVGDCLYMIASGTVAIRNSAGKEIRHLQDGSFFGGDALLNPSTKRKMTVTALEITETYRLTSKELQACLQPYPQIYYRLLEYDANLKKDD